MCVNCGHSDEEIWMPHSKYHICAYCGEQTTKEEHDKSLLLLKRKYVYPRYEIRDQHVQRLLFHMPRKFGR